MANGSIRTNVGLDEPTSIVDNEGKIESLGLSSSEVLRSIPGAILIYEATTDEEGIIYASDELIKMFECESLDDFIKYTNNSFKNVVHPDDIEEVERTIWDQINGGESGLDYVRYRVITKKGNIKHIEDFGHLVHSEKYGDIFYVFMHDLKNRDDILQNSELVGDMTKMFEEHALDDLTGLATTRSFRIDAPQFQNDILSLGDKPTYVFFDIDNFKSYNELYGFASGDRALKQISGILQDEFSNALIARLSADHFVVLTGDRDIEEKVKRSQARFATVGRGGLSISAGIYISTDLDMDVSSAYDRARIAMSSIKTRHDVDYCFYDETMGAKLHWQNYIVEHIDDAVVADNIRPFYQPVVRIDDGKLIGAEALARWNDPTNGELMPDMFIDTLEEFRLIHKLDNHIANDVCKMLSERLEDGEEVVPVSINLSQIDFEEADIVQLAENNVKKYGLSEDQIRIELTESCMTRYPEFLSRAIDRLHDKGFEVWMDDFGSGYSSLNVLQDYDFDLIKLDMRFLDHLETNPKTGVIIRAAASMARELGMKTLAEGAETKEQVDYLKGAGCDYVQGYYYGKPSEDFAELKI